MNRIRRFPLILTFLTVILLLQGTLSAARNLTVGIKESPPFTIKKADGTWTGISCDLWQTVADSCGWDYTYQETPLPDLLAGLEKKTLDAGFAALSITAAREQRFDFSHPYFVSRLGLVSAARARAGWLGALRPFFSLAFLKTCLALGLVLLAVGIIVWLFERKRNPQQFGGGAARGIGASFWWSAVTMTTVGYGDKAPATFAGRVVGIIWMFTAVIIISSFTAAISSSLTVNRLEPLVGGPEDLPRVQSVTLAGSTGEAYLKDLDAPFRTAATVAEGVRMVAAGEADAMVYDAPLLRYALKKDNPGNLSVMEIPGQGEPYGLAFPSGSPLREKANRVLLNVLGSKDWQKKLAAYLDGI